MAFKNIKAIAREGKPKSSAVPFDIPFGKSTAMPKNSADLKGPNKKKSGLAARLTGGK